jgi:hypothetical protein
MMFHPYVSSDDRTEGLSLLQLLEAAPPGERGSLLQSAVSFRPGRSLDESFAVGPLRAAFADFWEAETGRPIEPAEVRRILEPPIPIRTVLAFSKLALAGGASELATELKRLVRYLQDELVRHAAQLSLFEGADEQPPAHGSITPCRGSVRNLQQLVDTACRFPTIYADPPWPYENEASRGAAVNHYPTMSLDEIRAEPVGDLAADDAHLHLWATNAFLREAFDVIDAWGFDFKSCLVRIKSELGMGNYWRVSHEFLCDRSHKNSYVIKSIMWRRPRIDVRRGNGEGHLHHIILALPACRSGLLRVRPPSFVERQLESPRNRAAHQEQYVAFPRQPTSHLKAVGATTPHNGLGHIRIPDARRTGQPHLS